MTKEVCIAKNPSIIKMEMLRDIFDANEIFMD